MRKIRITADSSCDLFALSSVAFASAPMKVITDEKEFIDDYNLDVNQMANYLYEYKGKSKSSCPNPEDWLKAFGDADDIFCITITGGLSGSYNSACAAKKLYESEHRDRRVFVLDSLSAGPEMTLIIRKLEELISDGMPYEEICTQITEYWKNTGLVFMLKSVRTFANNGRISPIAAKLVGIANICIIGKASSEGTLEPIHKCRGEKNSLETLVNSLDNEGYRSGKISIGHCQNPDGSEHLKKMILAKYPKAEIEIHPFRGLCSFYAEKGGILVGFEKA